jgi:hypothetical protein
MLIKHAVLSKSAINSTPYTSIDGFRIERAALVALVEDGHHLVTLLEQRDL